MKIEYYIISEGFLNLIKRKGWNLLVNNQKNFKDIVERLSYFGFLDKKSGLKPPIITAPFPT